MDKQFKKGCVFIIGGSGGIGRACVQRFAEAGAKIVFTYHQNIQAARDAILHYEYHCVHVVLDYQS